MVHNPLEVTEEFLRAIQEIHQNSVDLGILVDDLRAEFARREKVCAHVRYPKSTITIAEKRELWESMGFARSVQEGLGNQYGLSMVKSALLTYQHAGEEHYLIACTLPDERVETKAIGRDLGLSNKERKRMHFAELDVAPLVLLTGTHQVGSISPLLSPRKLAEFSAVYFSDGLIGEAREHPTRLYDVPISPDNSLLVNAATLFDVLQGRDAKYTTTVPKEA